MIRAAIGLCVLAGLIWAVGIYRMGEKPLIGHLEEVYRSELVQKKIDALEKGIDAKITAHVEKAKQQDRPRRVAKQEQKERPAPLIDEPTPAPPVAPPAAVSDTVIDVRPPKAKAPFTRAKDTLTDADRDALDALLSQKLKR